MHDIIIVGGGPAGLTAAIYGLRAGKTVLVIEKNGFGGQIAYSPKVDGKVILISRVTCPNCRVAEGLLNKAGVAYEKQIAEENLDLCRAYNVKGAPTLIITDGEQYQSYYSVPEIKKFLSNR